MIVLGKRNMLRPI